MSPNLERLSVVVILIMGLGSTSGITSFGNVLADSDTNITETASPVIASEASQSDTQQQETQSQDEQSNQVDSQSRQLPTTGKQKSVTTQTQNHAPKANAGSDKKVKEGTNVVLDAKRSSDSDKDMLSYQWTQVTGQPLITIQNNDTGKASFTAPNVDKTTVLFFMVTVKDEKGAQSTDTVKVSIKNIDVPTVATSKDTTTKTDVIPQQNDKSTNPTRPTTTTEGFDNATAKALSNAQNALKNNNVNNNNLSKTTSTPTPNSQLSASGVFTAQGIGATGVVQSNSLVSSRAAYDIIFKTASTGIIGKMEMTFPAGTHVASPILVEVSGLGPGSLSVSGQTLIYTVTSPVSVPAGVYLRLEIWRISNPATPSNSLQVQIATKTSGGSTIDTGSSTMYFVRQIATNDIANNAVTTPKIAPGAVTPSVFPRFGTPVSINPGDRGFATVFCNPGEVVSGGGYQTSSEKLIVTDQGPNDEIDRQWIIEGFNTDVVARSLNAVVQCLHMVP